MTHLALCRGSLDERGMASAMRRWPAARAPRMAGSASARRATCSTDAIRLESDSMGGRRGNGLVWGYGGGECIDRRRIANLGQSPARDDAHLGA